MQGAELSAEKWSKQLGGTGSVATIADLENVGESVTDLNVNTEILTSANNREQLLNDIKTILEDLTSVTRVSSFESKNQLKKLGTAIKDTSEYV